MTVRLDHSSEQAREDRRIILDLVAAMSGGMKTYVLELQAVMDAALADPDPAGRVTHLLDAAVQIADLSLVGWASGLGVSAQDVMAEIENHEWPES